ncbi:MAG: serine/threonine protein kinase [Ahniella sp.]|nr:serine/threonine protein kinase [Ahniella sp.]
MRLQPGEVFAGYKVVRQLGRGGMAYVYLAEEAAAGRMVALKLLMEDLLEEPQFQARFEHEAKTIASLEHPAIVPMYRYGVERDVAWMALRYVEGGDLSARLKRTLAIPEGLRVFRQIADAIDFAHRRGVIHRDIKPQNVLMSQDGHVYLADFGIAKVLSGAAKLRTATGMVLGSPQYMSPECARGDPPGQASDIYALGVMAFQWLTGDVPFDADTRRRCCSSRPGIRYRKRHSAPWLRQWLRSCDRSWTRTRPNGTPVPAASSISWRRRWLCPNRQSSPKRRRRIKRCHAKWMPQSIPRPT